MSGQRPGRGKLLLDENDCTMKKKDKEGRVCVDFCNLCYMCINRNRCIGAQVTKSHLMEVAALQLLKPGKY